MKIVDTSGLRCPQPIIETKKALGECSRGEVFIVVIDNPSSLRNVSRFLDDNKIMYSANEENGKWTLTVNSEKGAVVTSEAENYCDSGMKETAGQGFGVAISSEVMGSGDDNLGKRLMKSFFVTISCMDRPPSVIAFYNSGVKLLSDDQEIIEIVREMEMKNVEVLVCGTCLDHYGIGERIGAGKIADMLTITTRLADSGNVIRP